MGTHIEWTERTWNPVIGCTKVSPGCTHCYAETVAGSGRLQRLPAYQGIVAPDSGGRPRWTGEVRFLPERLAHPLKVRRPTMWFVNSMSDLFHEGVTDQQIAAVFGVMAACPQHTFQVLTKRPERAVKWFEWVQDNARTVCRVSASALVGRRTESEPFDYHTWPLPNVWIGVSVEDQRRANERVPLLRQIATVMPWISQEPTLGPVDLLYAAFNGADSLRAMAGIGWVVVGGESGKGYRPMDPDWARSTRDQCAAAGVPFFMKQMAGKRPIPADLMVRQYPEVAA